MVHFESVLFEILYIRSLDIISMFPENFIYFANTQQKTLSHANVLFIAEID